MHIKIQNVLNILKLSFINIPIISQDMMKNIIACVCIQYLKKNFKLDFLVH